jgi:hypothetical protein
MTPAQRLRRELLAGEAPALLTGDEVCTLLDLTPRQLEMRVRDGALDDMAPASGRSLFRSSQVRRLVQGSLAQPPHTTPVNSGTYRPPQPQSGAPDSRNDAGASVAALAPLIAEIRASGATTLQRIADALNERGVTTSTGGQWHVGSVARMVDRLAALS